MSQDPPDDGPGARTLPRLGVWQLAWPTMASFAFQSLVGLVDTIIVAGLGSTDSPEIGRNAVAAAALATQIHFFAFAVLSAVTIGTTALVARSIGAEERGDADRVLRASVLLAAALAGGMMLAMPFTERIVAAFGVEPEVVRLGGSFLRILLLFNIPFAYGLVVSSGLRGAGDVRTPLWIGAVTNLLNLVGCYALVFGMGGAPRLETDGAALAGGLSFTVGAAIYGILWVRNRLIVRRRSWFEGLTPALFRRILRIGVPTALEQVAWNLGLFVFLGMVASFGTEAVAAYLIGVRILSFSFVPGLGFSTAASTLVGQHLGAQNPRRAARSGWRANFAAIAVMGSAGFVICLFAPGIAGWFGATGEGTVALTIVFIYILGAAQPLMAIEFTLGGALRGAGDTRFPLVAILTGLFLFRLGGAVIVTRVFDGSVVALWSCLLADYAVKAALLTWRFASGRWKSVSI